MQQPSTAPCSRRPSSSYTWMHVCAMGWVVLVPLALVFTVHDLVPSCMFKQHLTDAQYMKCMGKHMGFHTLTGPDPLTEPLSLTGSHLLTRSHSLMSTGANDQAHGQARDQARGGSGGAAGSWPLRVGEMMPSSSFRHGTTPLHAGLGQQGQHSQHWVGGSGVGNRRAASKRNMFGVFGTNRHSGGAVGERVTDSIRAEHSGGRSTALTTLFDSVLMMGGGMGEGSSVLGQGQGREHALGGAPGQDADVQKMLIHINIKAAAARLGGLGGAIEGLVEEKDSQAAALAGNIDQFDLQQAKSKLVNAMVPASSTASSLSSVSHEAITSWTTQSLSTPGSTASEANPTQSIAGQPDPSQSTANESNPAQVNTGQSNPGQSTGSQSNSTQSAAATYQQPAREANESAQLNQTHLAAHVLRVLGIDGPMLAPGWQEKAGMLAPSTWHKVFAADAAQKHGNMHDPVRHPTCQVFVNHNYRYIFVMPPKMPHSHISNNLATCGMPLDSARQLSEHGRADCWQKAGWEKPDGMNLTAAAGMWHRYFVVALTENPFLRMLRVYQAQAKPASVGGRELCGGACSWGGFCQQVYGTGTSPTSATQPARCRTRATRRLRQQAPLQAPCLLSETGTMAVDYIATLDTLAQDWKIVLTEMNTRRQAHVVVHGNAPLYVQRFGAGGSGMEWQRLPLAKKEWVQQLYTTILHSYTGQNASCFHALACAYAQDIQLLKPRQK